MRDGTAATSDNPGPCTSRLRPRGRCRLGLCAVGGLGGALPLAAAPLAVALPPVPGPAPRSRRGPPAPREN
eukprot:7127784-Prymnesium_polylepis.1